MTVFTRTAAVATIVAALSGGAVAAPAPPSRILLAQAPAATPAEPAPATDWLSSLWQPFQNTAAWIAGWLVAEEQAIEDEVSLFAKTLESDIAALEQLVEDTGFSLEELNIGVGPLPEVSLTLGFERRLETAERDALLARVNAEGGAYGVIERALVDVMLAAADTNYAAGAVGGYRLEGLEVDVDLIPKVTLVVVPAEAEAAPAERPTAAVAR